MKNKFLQYTLLGCTLMFLFSACRKDSFKGTETKESGKTFVYIEQAQVNSQFFDVFTDVKAISMFTVRRDAASKADLQKSVTVSLKAMDQTYIDAYNTKNGTDYTLLPTSIFTLNAQPGVALAANADLTLNFAAGDFAKNIIFNVDGSKVDLSKQYAVAYVITNFGGFSKQHTSSGVSQDTILASVAIKNKWDGVYTFSGTMIDKTNATLTDFNNYLQASDPDNYPALYELRTISATSCDVYSEWAGGYYFLITSGTSYSQYGSFRPVFSFDPATNKVVSVVNAYGQPAGNGRYAQLDATGAVNAYDPGTKTVTVKWDMVGGSGVAANEVRTTFDYVFTYVGPR